MLAKLGENLEKIQAKSETIQGRFRNNLDKVQKQFREDSGKIIGENYEKIQVKFLENLDTIERKFRNNSNKIYKKLGQNVVKFKENLKKFQ